MDRAANHRLAFLAILIAAILGGGIPVFSKIALLEIPPLSYTSLRFTLSLIFVLPLFLREKPTITKSSLKIVALSFLATLNVVFFAYGVRLTSAGAAQVLYTSAPIIAVVLSYLLLKERLGGRKVLGVLVGFIGTSLVIGLPALHTGSLFAGALMGNLIIFTAVISFTTYSVLSKKFQKKYTPIYLTTFFILTAVFTSTILSAGELSSNPGWWNNVGKQSLFSVAYVGILGTSVYYVLYQYAIKYGSPVIASTVLYLQPIATFFWAAILLGERLTTPFIFGAALALLGAWLTTRAKVR